MMSARSTASRQSFSSTRRTETLQSVGPGILRLPIFSSELHESDSLYSHGGHALQDFSAPAKKMQNVARQPLPVIPPPQHEETILSWLTRTSCCYGIGVPSLIEYLDPESDMFLLSRVGRILIPSTDLNNLLERHLRITRLQIGGFYPYIACNLKPEFWLRNEMAWCPYCVTEDKGALGFTYDRIDWWLACVTRCRKHDVFLHDRCPRCNSRGYMAIAPNNTRYLSCLHCSHKLEDLCVARVEAGYFPKPGEVYDNPTVRASVRPNIGRNFEDRLIEVLTGKDRDLLPRLEISEDTFLDIILVIHAFIEDSLKKAEWMPPDSLPLVNENSLAACRTNDGFERMTDVAILARKLLPGLCPAADLAFGYEAAGRLSQYDLKRVIRPHFFRKELWLRKRAEAWGGHPGQTLRWWLMMMASQQRGLMSTRKERFSDPNGLLSNSPGLVFQDRSLPSEKKHPTRKKSAHLSDNEKIIREAKQRVAQRRAVEAERAALRKKAWP
ncbi:TniQ family protein [Acetobacter sacchari]|uniref:TniQ family protein n=1 Tax=Acetobacter sacchari TaxID=2661687 RepID=A0ABS3LWE2_9PROT|nr:TniQ family protein [Acetobacter sacchari]MBO1360253.1 TniQ family protein [Acetobacter sacchari]